MYILTVTAGGELSAKEAEPDLLTKLQETVGGFIEIVHPKNLPRPFCMIVDDEGRMKQKPVNEIASILYGYPTACKHPIVGDVALVKDVELPDGERDIGGLSEEDINTIVGLISKERRIWVAQAHWMLTEAAKCCT